MDTLRFITCGSVDDGKSTLIGRLLYETKMVLSDQLETLESDSKKFGTQGERLDFALLVDGLSAEREQGITIDVAYRFFATEQRRFIVADTPGHEQYTRNMVTGASTADAAVILIDARKGLLVQTMRHSRIVSMLGIKHVVLAINKMDLVGWSEAVFSDIERHYREFAAPLGFATIQAIPVSALDGQNIMIPAVSETSWYQGPTLLEWLETVSVGDDTLERPFSMAVQWVNRPNLDFRGFAGRIATGTVKPGDRIRVSPSGTESRVKEIMSGSGALDRAEFGESISIVLENEIDISRGDVIGSALAPVEASDQFEADLIWMNEQPLLPGRAYSVLMHAKAATATVSDLKFKRDINSGSELAARKLDLNEIGVANLSFDRLVPFRSYVENKRLGSFILIDKLTNETVAAGMIRHALRRSSNLHWQAVDVTKTARSAMKGQKARCLWFTGLSGSGKSTIANLLERRLFADGRHTYLLDGDNIRHGLNRDLGFTDAERVENIRRVAEVAKLMVDAGLLVIVSFISPFRSERAMARALFEEGEFLEIFADAPLEECEKRDVKGLYAKARRGELKNFTGMDSPYEEPIGPEIHLKTADHTPEECATSILERLI